MAARVAARGALLVTLTAASSGHADPAQGDAAAIEEGRRLYRTRCYICHLGEGGRGPNLFASRLSDEQFVEVVINGRKGTQMPAFGLRMGPDEAAQVRAFVRSTTRYQ